MIFDKFEKKLISLGIIKLSPEQIFKKRTGMSTADYNKLALKNPFTFRLDVSFIMLYGVS